jgi:hypothetical protein
MRNYLLFGTWACLAGSLLAAESGPQGEVKAAAGKLADKSGYSWKTTVAVPEGSQFRPGPTEGKTEKEGFTCVMMTRGDTTTEAFLKGGKGAIKTADGWQSLAEATQAGDGQRGRGMFLARRLQNFRVPAAEAEDLVAQTKDLKKDGDVYTGTLTEDGAKAYLMFGPRPGGGDGPAISNAKGSVKFWLKEGVLSKYEYQVQGTVSFGGNDRDMDRTTTVEIKDVGATKVDLPEDARKKLS